jgi:hypothetical protein
MKETKKIIQRINETKGWFLEKINNIDKSLSNLTKTRGKRPILVKLEMRGHNKHHEIWRILTNYSENL